MRKYKINGRASLQGNVRISGAKNAALPILTSTILLSGESVIRNIPRLNDVITIIRVLRTLGVKAEYSESEPNTVRVLTPPKIKHVAPYELVTKMRASFFVLGPILARTGLAKVPLPGGCAIGSRPVNLHLHGLRNLGAEIEFEHGFVIAKAKKLIGSTIHFDVPSVGATENILMAAVLAEGETTLENAAKEPEIVDLANFLNSAGAKITGMGTETIKIKGVESLYGIEYKIIPDRIEAGTYMIAAAITGGEISVKEVFPEHLESLIHKLKTAGVKVSIDGNSIKVKSNSHLKAVDIRTLPYPGFPTDMQPQFSTLMAVAEGTSVINESVFENRFMFINELKRMGANIRVENQSAIICGVEKLSSAPVRVSDLRAGAALLIAGLASSGETMIEDQERQIERGYEDICEKLREMGAEIEVL